MSNHCSGGGGFPRATTVGSGPEAPATCEGRGPMSKTYLSRETLRAVGRGLTGNHSRAVGRGLTGNHSRAVGRGLTGNHSRAVGQGPPGKHSRAVAAVRG